MHINWIRFTDADKLAEILLQRPLNMQGVSPFSTRLTEKELGYLQEMAKKRFDIVLTTLKQMPKNMLFVVRFGYLNNSFWILKIYLITKLNLLLFSFRNLNTIRAIARQHGDPLDRPLYMAKYAQKCIYNKQRDGIIRQFKWIFRRIRFDYHLLQARLQFWFIRMYLNVLLLLSSSTTNSSAILNYSPNQ